MKKTVPQLQYLDDEPLLDNEPQQPQHASEFDEDWKLIDELVKEGMVMPEEKIENMPGSDSHYLYYFFDDLYCLWWIVLCLTEN